MTGRSEWQTRVGQVWAQEWRRTDRALGGVAERLNAAIEACAPRSGHAVDVGCGAGSTTLALAAMRPDLRVTGLDLSPDLLGTARMRGEGHSNVTFAEGDALVILPALEPLDMIVSRHGVMFFDDPLTAFARMRAAMQPGAALVFSCFRARAENDWAVALDAAVGAAPAVPLDYTPGPFGLADHGFTGICLAGPDGPTSRRHPMTLPTTSVGEAIRSRMRSASSRGSGRQRRRLPMRTRGSVLPWRRVCAPCSVRAWWTERSILPRPSGSGPRQQGRPHDRRPSSGEQPLATHPVDAGGTGAAL